MKQKNKTIFATLSILIALFLAGCTEPAQPVEQWSTAPTFSVELEITPDQKIQGNLLVGNESVIPFPANENFEAVMNLWSPDGQLRSKIEAHIIQEIKPGESVSLASANWQLDPGMYILTWGTPEYGGVVRIFTIAKTENQITLKSSLNLETKPAQYETKPSHAGSITSFSLDEDQALTIKGETSLPDDNCLIPLLLDQEGIVSGFPIGSCADIQGGQWELNIPILPGAAPITLDPEKTYTAILIIGDPTIPPSQPFIVEISPPKSN